ncbi:hypothetical protein ABS324_26595 (plasmid) [Bacillus cereus]|nr:hypothetical protein [Bacillus cereus]
MDFNTPVTVMVSTKCGLNYKKWLRILGKVLKLITSHEEKTLRRNCSDKFLEEAPIATSFFFVT